MIKRGFARKVITKQTTSFARKIFSFARNKYLGEFVLYVIMIGAGWMMLNVLIMMAWNWFIVEVTIEHPIDFVGAMGASIIMGLVFLFLFLLGEVK